MLVFWCESRSFRLWIFSTTLCCTRRLSSKSERSSESWNYWCLFNCFWLTKLQFHMVQPDGIKQLSMVVRSWDSGVRLLGFTAWFSPSLVIELWVSYLTSLSLGVLIYKRDSHCTHIIAFTVQGSNDIIF